MRNLVLSIILPCLVLTACKGGRGDTQLVARLIDPTVEPNEFLTFTNQKPEIGSAAYATRYYQTVDPMDQRTTLDDWKTLNGFAAAVATHATFRDAKDLGYGRDMYGWENGGDILVYVDNYVVELQPGDALSYGPLNLDAAINQERKFQIGTNAIEFSPGPDGIRIAKFFTFAPPDASGMQARVVKADQDGRGEKFMPTMCVVCHGGTMYPLTKNGDFHPISLKSPRMHIIEQNSVEFSALAGLMEADQAPAIKKINQLVYKTYEQSGMRMDVNGDTRTASVPSGSNNFVPGNDDRANWDSTFARELLDAAYAPGGVNGPDSYVPDAVPSGWQQTPTRPNGVETLYRRVVAPHCIGCHTIRGTQIGETLEDPVSGRFPNAVAFSSYENFIAYNDEIIDTVYRLGTMPSSLLNYDQFWTDPDDKPTLLATFLTGFNVFDTNGKVVRPGKSVARPGADRTVPSGTALAATASAFTASYAWQINPMTVPAAGASLDDPASSAPVLTANDGFDVFLDLVTSNANGSSDIATLKVTIDNMPLPDIPANLTFADHIQPILDTKCAFCHKRPVDPAFPPVDTVNSNYTGIPVYFDNTLASDLYNEVMARIDLVDPEYSLLLRKATTNAYHSGGANLSSTDADYITILNWIRSGAPCGTNVLYC